MSEQFNIPAILDAYIVCALWSSVDEQGNPLDDSCNVDDIEPETLERMRQDVTDFVQSNSSMLEQSGLDDAQIGHDFWLTRNGHGAGFWDRGLGEVGKKLSDAARIYGGVDLYIGDDGKVY